MVIHVDIWTPLKTCGIYIQRFPQKSSFLLSVIFPKFPQCRTAALLSVCMPNWPEWRMELFEWRLCKRGPVDKVRPREICGIILRHVCLFSQVGTWSTLGWREKCHTMIHSIKIYIFLTSTQASLSNIKLISIIEHQKNRSIKMNTVGYYCKL